MSCFCDDGTNIMLSCHALCLARTGTGSKGWGTLDFFVAHADMQLPNIAMYLEGQHWHVKFLDFPKHDFNWAGLAGQHTYPPFINPKIVWLVSICPCVVMLPEHDVTLLHMQIDQRMWWLRRVPNKKLLESHSFVFRGRRTIPAKSGAFLLR